MRTALVTITSGSKYEKLAEVTHPTLLAYALRIGAEFIVWRDVKGHSIPAYKKLEIGSLLETYDRVLYVDTDILIRQDAPNLFDLVPETHVGLFDEGRFMDRRQAKQHLAPTEIEFFTRQEYYNTGVMVVSRCHRDMFVQPSVQVDNFMEQTWLNLTLHKADFPVLNLPHRFNRMIWLDRSGESRLDSYFLHYAGILSNGIDQLDAVRQDLERWTKDAPFYSYPRQIHFTVRGGLGDQVCAEPVLRYVTETIYHSDRVLVHTDYPELFEHLDVECLKFGDTLNAYGFHCANLTPRVDGQDANFSLMHQTDFASIKAFGGIIPMPQRVVRLPDFSELSRAVDQDTVLIHASKWWPTKTFPESFWAMVAEEAREAGLKPVFIGKIAADDGPSVISPEGFDSLVDRTDLRQLIGAIQRCGLLITTDSAPLHIAASSTCRVGLVSPIRQPWTLISNLFQTEVLVKPGHQPWMQPDFSPNAVESVSLDDPKFVPGVLESLPTREQIREFLTRKPTF